MKIHHLASLVFVLGCAGGQPTVNRPDFMKTDNVDMRMTSIQFLTDAEVKSRLADLATVATTDPVPRVRDQVVLRLGKWARPAALPILRRVYRDDTHPDVARAALGKLRTLCFAKHGMLSPVAPPPGPVSPECAVAYDGSWHLPQGQPPPREGSQAFWADENIPHKTMPNGEIWPSKPKDRMKARARYPWRSTTRYGARPSEAP